MIIITPEWYWVEVNSKDTCIEACNKEFDAWKIIYDSPHETLTNKLKSAERLRSFMFYIGEYGDMTIADFLQTKYALKDLKVSVNNLALI